MCRLIRFSFEIIVEMFFTNLCIVIDSTFCYPSLLDNSYTTTKQPTGRSSIFLASSRSAISVSGVWYRSLISRLKLAKSFVLRTLLCI